MKRYLFISLISIGLGIFGIFYRLAWFLFLAMLALLFYKSERKKVILIYVLLFLLSSSYANLLLNRYENWEDMGKTQVLLYILDQKGQTYIGKIYQADRQEIKNEKLYFYSREELNFGQVYKASFKGASFNRQRIPWGFDQRKYYLSNKVNFKGDLLEIKELEVRPPLYAELLKFRQKIMEDYCGRYSGRAQGLVQALVFGDKSLFPQEVKDSFQLLGLSHLLAVSGLHGGIVASAAYKLFSPAGFRWKNYAAWFFILAYAFLAGFTPSINRAALMFFLFSLGKFLLRHRDIWTIMAASALPQILWNPFVIFSAGFQLSYLTLASIVYLGKEKNIFSASLAALTGSLPLLLYYFNSFSLPGLWANLFYIPLFAMITLVSIAGLFLPFLPLARFANCTINLIIEGTEEIAELFSFMDFSASSPRFLEVSLYYLILALLYRKIKVKKQLLGVLLSGLLFVNILPANWQMTFLDVGQGDAALIVTEKDQALVIDGGPWGQELENYLSSKGINRPFLYIVSHADSDHINGIIWLMKKKPPKYIILPANAQENELNQELLCLAQKKKTQVLYGSKGQKFQIDSCQLEILLPEPESKFSNHNDHSLVLLLSCKDKNFLFTGDIEKNILDQLELKEDIHILKAPHHGSNTGASEKFFGQTRIENTVISCGQNNRYGHPGAKFMDILEKTESGVFRTDISGTIIVTFKGKELKIKGYLN